MWLKEAQNIVQTERDWLAQQARISYVYLTTMCNVHVISRSCIIICLACCNNYMLSNANTIILNVYLSSRNKCAVLFLWKIMKTILNLCEFLESFLSNMWICKSQFFFSQTCFAFKYFLFLQAFNKADCIQCIWFFVSLLRYIMPYSIIYLHIKLEISNMTWKIILVIICCVGAIFWFLFCWCALFISKTL